MACQLSILNAVGQGQPGAPLMSLKITGSATGCTSVSATILCTGQQPVQHNAIPVIAGQWETTFTQQELKVAGCQECASSSYPLVVRARCDDGAEQCADFRSWAAIPCGVQGCCPVVSIQVSEGGCEGQGLRNVTFVVTTTLATDPGCPDTVFAQLDFGDGMLGAGFVVPPSGVWQETHPYVPGSYTAKVRIIAPPGCPDIPVKVGPLAECPPGCPDQDDVTVAVNGCDADDRRIVSLNVMVPGSGSTTGSVDWQDGTTTGPDPVQGGTLWTVFHPYAPPGPYKATVTITGCPPITKAIGPLEPCPGSGPGNGGGGTPCPWWKPKCWKHPCGALLAGAMAAIITAGILFISAGCVVLTPAVLAGGLAAALGLLLGSALFIAALSFLATGLALLTLWYSLCAHLPGYNFCAALHQVMTTIAWLIVAQSALALLLFSIGGIGCLIGMVFMWGSYGTVLAYLQILKNWAGCPH